MTLQSVLQVTVRIEQSEGRVIAKGKGAEERRVGGNGNVQSALLRRLLYNVVQNKNCVHRGIFDEHGHCKKNVLCMTEHLDVHVQV